MKTFGEVISELRKERGLTQKALASQIKKKDGVAIGIAYINDIEHDRRNPPSPDFVAQLATVLGVPLEVLQYYAGRLPSDENPGRSFASADRSGLPCVSEGDRQKAEVSMKERTVPRRQPRLVYYTRDQRDELCEKIIVDFCMARYG